jgi:large subunit ribosomal protein L10
MAMTKTEKQSEIEVLKAKFADSEVLFLTKNLGLDAVATNDLRVASRAAGVDYRVAKNTLARIALKGTVFEILGDKMKGPTAFVTGKDPIQTAKVIAEFAKKNPKLEIVGGFFEGEVMDAKAVEAFSKMPTLNEIRSQLVGLLQAPASQIVGVTKAYGEKEAEAAE